MQPGTADHHDDVFWNEEDFPTIFSGLTREQGSMLLHIVVARNSSRTYRKVLELFFAGPQQAVPASYVPDMIERITHNPEAAQIVLEQLLQCEGKFAGTPPPSDNGNTANTTTAPEAMKLPHADIHGFFRFRGARYGLVTAWSRELAISDKAIAARLARAKPISGLNFGSEIRENAFYGEHDVTAACKRLLELAPLNTNKAGFIGITQADESIERFGTAETWAQDFGIPLSTIIKRLAAASMGKHSSKRLYAETTMLLLLEDVLHNSIEA